MPAAERPTTRRQSLDASGLGRVMRVYCEALGAHREAINSLNVYPVPDGDTGTNMALTLGSVCAALDSAANGGATVDMAATCAAMSQGSLMGARGNSGVILSQVMRGMAEVLRDRNELDGEMLAIALRAAAEGAYKAVMRPVEGTILTVVREAAEGAEAQACAGGANLLDVAESARARASGALARTPELLDVLRDAGVVDAGGAGFVLLLDALLHVVDGRPVPEPPPIEQGGLASPAADGRSDEAERAARGEGRPVGTGPRYEVMYFLETADERIGPFKDAWAAMGDSIAVVGGDGLWNCHIHTDDIGGSIEAALDCGRPRDIRVTDLVEQVEEERWVRDAADAADAPPHTDRPVRCAVVAVSTGAGIARIFYSLGVQRIVSGGQSMNPSTAQLLEAVEAAPAAEVVILPNNKNIVAVAEQAGAQTAKSVRVVPTRGVTEGFAALLAYDPQAEVAANAEGMGAAAGAIVAGEITRAVRDATWKAGAIREGDYIGIARSARGDGDGIRAVDASLSGAALALLAQLVSEDHEVVTVIEGDGSTAADTRRITRWLDEHRPHVSTDVHHGGQPLYPYLFGVE